MTKFYINERTNNLICEDLTNDCLIFRNFSGVNNTKFPNIDNKGFSIIINDLDLIEDLKNLGWDIRIWAPKRNDDPDAEPIHHLPVKVKFKDRYGQPMRRQPEINLWSRGVKTNIGEEGCTPFQGESVSTMDCQTFESLMLEIHLGPIDETRGTGVAYLVRLDGKLFDNPIDDLTSKWYADEHPEE